MRKQAAVRLKFGLDESQFPLTTKLPNGSTAIVEATNDLLSWSLAERVPSDTALLESPIATKLGHAQFFRLRFND